MRNIKSFKIFESVDSADEVLSIVKDLVSELDFIDINQNVVIRRMDNKEYIRIILGKPTQFVRQKLPPRANVLVNSFEWSDVKSVMVPVMEYLSEEGYEWVKNKGTHAYKAAITDYEYTIPNVVSGGSAMTDRYKTRIEMWFEKI
jgi:hypothetical protein